MNDLSNIGVNDDQLNLIFKCDSSLPPCLTCRGGPGFPEWEAQGHQQRRGEEEGGEEARRPEKEPQVKLQNGRKFLKILNAVI